MHEALIRNKNGYTVMAYQVIQPAPSVEYDDYGHYVPVATFSFEGDAMEVRELINRGGMNENRLKMLIKNYDGTPKRIVKYSHGEPVFRKAQEL